MSRHQDNRQCAVPSLFLASAFMVLVLLATWPSNAQQNRAGAAETDTPGLSDLAITVVNAGSGHSFGDVRIWIEVANLGTAPSEQAEVTLTLKIGEWALQLSDMEYYAVISDSDELLSDNIVLKPIAPGERTTVQLFMWIPNEIMAAMEATVSIESLRIPIQAAVVLRKTALDSDTVNNFAVALLEHYSPIRLLSNNNGPDLPKLMPWPPPEASARLVLDRQPFLVGLADPAAPPTLGAIGDLVTHALSADGHRRFGFLGVPGNGFALLTGVEQIDENAVPLKGSARWSQDILVEPVSASDPGAWLAAVVDAFFFAPKGHYRVLLFIVTDVPFSENPDIEISTWILEDWAVKSFDSIPDQIRALDFSTSHKMTVLVYEFEKQANEEPATRIGGHSVRDHLRNTQLARFIDPQ